MRHIYSSFAFGSIHSQLDIEADFDQASSPIRWRECAFDPWMGTPYQAADVQHNPNTAIDTVAEWLNLG